MWNRIWEQNNGIYVWGEKVGGVVVWWEEAAPI